MNKNLINKERHKNFLKIIKYTKFPLIYHLVKWRRWKKPSLKSGLRLKCPLSSLLFNIHYCSTDAGQNTKKKRYKIASEAVIYVHHIIFFIWIHKMTLLLAFLASGWSYMTELRQWNFPGQAFTSILHTLRTSFSLPNVIELLYLY